MCHNHAGDTRLRASGVTCGRYGSSDFHSRGSSLRRQRPTLSHSLCQGCSLSKVDQTPPHNPLPNRLNSRLELSFKSLEIIVHDTNIQDPKSHIILLSSLLFKNIQEASVAQGPQGMPQTFGNKLLSHLKVNPKAHSYLLDPNKNLAILRHFLWILVQSLNSPC